MDRRSFAYEDDLWRPDSLTGVSVTRGGRTVRLGGGTACCDGGGEVVVVMVAVIEFTGGEQAQQNLTIARQEKWEGNINSGDGGWGVHPRFASRFPSPQLCKYFVFLSQTETPKFHSPYV